MIYKLSQQKTSNPKNIFYTADILSDLAKFEMDFSVFLWKLLQLFDLIVFYINISKQKIALKNGWKKRKK